MLKIAPDRPEQPQTPTLHALKSEVVWFPPALLLLGFQAVVLMRGLRPSLSEEAHAAYLSSLVLLGLSLVLMLLGLARDSRLWRVPALITLVAGVAADMFVATNAATGSIPNGLWMALLLVTMWAAVWSITDSQLGL